MYGHGIDLEFKKADSLSTRDFDACLTYCFTLLKNNPDNNAYIPIKTIIGKAHYFKGNYDSAALYYQSAIKQSEENNIDEKLAFTYNELAKLYRRTKKYVESMLYYDKALQQYINEKDSAGISMIYNESGVVYEFQKKYKEALQRYKKSHEICIIKKDTIGQAYALNFMANIYTEINEYAIANTTFKRSIALSNTQKDSFAQACCYFDMAKCYTKYKKIAEAKQVLDSTYYFATKLHYQDLLANYYLQHSIIDSLNKDYVHAYTNYKMYTSVKDSIFTIENTKVIEELNTQYHLSKKEQTILQQHNSIQKKNSILAITSIAFLLVSLLGYSVYKRKKIEQEKRLQQELLAQKEKNTQEIIEAEEGERKRIAADLHDGIGQLLIATKLNLEGLKTKNTPEEKEKIIRNVVDLVNDSVKEVRSVSHNIMPNALVQSNLYYAIKEFVEKMDSSTLKIIFHAELQTKKINKNIEIVTYRIIQECVNNVIKHARASRLDITLDIDEELMNIIIEDNGVGFDVQEAIKKNGIGLQNIKTRVAFLKATIDIDSKINNGTAIVFHIPIHSS